MPRYNLPAAFPTGLAEAMLMVGEELLRQSSRAFRIERPRVRRGATLRPGNETPLWNELRALLRPRLRKYGEQVNLGRPLVVVLLFGANQHAPWAWAIWPGPMSLIK
jgi:hypothetical protein